MAKKLTLELQETEVSLGGREFVLREMSAEKQNKFYLLLNDYAQNEKRIAELRQVEAPSAEQVAEIEKLAGNSVDFNQKIWTMMLIPNDENREAFTAEWLGRYTNGRMGDLVMQEQLTLNDFDNTMGKIIAQATPQAAALGVELAHKPLGPTTAAPLAAAITSTL